MVKWLNFVWVLFISGHCWNATGGPYPPQAAHTIVGGGDEHRILTTPGPSQQQQQQHVAAKYSQRPPKFSAIVNEYMGACLEDHCNIGKTSIIYLKHYVEP